MTKCNIVEVIRRETAGLRGRIAVVDGMYEPSYGELLDAVDRTVTALAAAGIRRLDRVAFFCEDGVDYIIGSLAILGVGAVVVPVSPSLMSGELEQVVDRMDAGWVLADAVAGEGVAGEAFDGGAFLERTFRLRSRLARHDLPAEYASLNPAFIRFSSGTTGISKGVLLSHEAVVARTNAANQGLHITADDVVVWVLSMSFHFVATILLYLQRGATIVICRQPFPETFITQAARRRGTVFYASPFHYHLLATSPLVPANCLAGVRLAVSTAMKLSAETAELFSRKFGLELAEAYGIIEVGLPCIHSGRRDERGSLGPALPAYEVRIAEPDVAGSGLLQFRGPGMFDAYVSPWVTWAEVCADGWFNTGDIGRIDAGGNITILGRRKSVINFAGMKVFPEEVETVLGEHPGVAECWVYGEQHPIYGQIPCAQVVPREPGNPPAAAALRQFCFRRLSAQHVPKSFTFVDALERTESGKVRRG